MTCCPLLGGGGRNSGARLSPTPDSAAPVRAVPGSDARTGTMDFLLREEKGARAYLM